MGGIMKVRYDKKYDILYIDLYPEKKASETVPLNDDIYADVDENGNIIGLEIWRASQTIAKPIAETIVKEIKKALKQRLIE
ncbi:MAG: DUF2283 domain-containing protein [Thermoprotei archaeon]|nr:MAG: DUF2283 domain-containing protein [Thermoprotei archaeon]